MKIWIIFGLLLSCSSYAVAKHHPEIPNDAIGVLTVESTTQGELLWIKGRVGSGQYISIDQQGRHCSLEVPVAIGEVGDADIGIEWAKGLTMIITSQALSDALNQGKRVNSADWRISYVTEARQADARVVSGITADEGFILNSRRRWISWLLDDRPAPICW
ncbi:hypothetical protein [Vibrio sp. 16]|uniref:hypothetical protein n=1 Tax=Vibrio sp. 16 TaxID=391586 RepID=UPI00018F40AB|nr:hypothetical protein [Vibrio sp. 16]EED25950.1 conserved hypothetical protein [Vibrio sp. 16]CAK4068425.1 hypothetical protein VDT1_1143 [Vibrio sp. 16]